MMSAYDIHSFCVLRTNPLRTAYRLYPPPLNTAYQKGDVTLIIRRNTKRSKLSFFNISVQNVLKIILFERTCQFLRTILILDGKSEDMRRQGITEILNLIYLYTRLRQSAF